MSEYGHYSSDNGSDDEIGLPKTPGAPLNVNQSDSDDNDSYEIDDDNDSNHNNQNNSDDSDDDHEQQRQQQSNRHDGNDASHDDDENDDHDNLSHKERSSEEEDNSWDESRIRRERQQQMDNSSSEEQSEDDDEQRNQNIRSKSPSLNNDSDSSMDNHQREELRQSTDGQKRQRDSSPDSPDSPVQQSKKRKRIQSSDDDESNDSRDNENEAPKPEDLFGELSDEDDNMENDMEKSKENNDNQRRMNIDDEDEDEEEEDGENYHQKINDEMNEIFGDDNDNELENIGMDEEDAVIPETRIEVEIPRITANLGDNIHFVKLPNFLSIDTHPYDPQWYEDEIDEDEVHDDEGRARLKLKVENTIRWRNVAEDDGTMVKESNARVVQWSDGSMSLHLGDEIFDIQTFNLLPGENNHLFIRQGTGLQGQSVFKTKLTFRPFSTESFTHRKLTLSLADRSQKTQKICVLPNVGKDPEAHRSEMIKKEEVKLKQSIRKENKPRRTRDRSFTRGGVYLDDEDDESISISKIKNQYKRPSINSNYPNSQYDKEQQDQDYEEESENDDEDDDDSDLDIFEKKKKNTDKKKIVDSDDEDDDDNDDDADDDDDA